MIPVMGSDDARQRWVLGTETDWYKSVTRDFREEDPVTYVITEPCIGTKDQSCVEVCPVDCIYDAGDHFMINPEECIDCGACEPECPVEAIYPEDEVPDDMESYTTKAANYFEEQSRGRSRTARLQGRGPRAPPFCEASQHFSLLFFQ
jgi:NAD-dependent dihydropyrimidine dehydrogenase PreA subunit